MATRNAIKISDVAKIFHAGNDGCGSVYVENQIHGGRGGDPSYAGGFIVGHTGHAASMMSSDQMRRLATALIEAADAIENAGIPSFQNRHRCQRD
jgi:hypothetical protein